MMLVVIICVRRSLRFQRRSGRLCHTCNDGYYPFFGGCEPCPDARGACRFALSADFRSGSMHVCLAAGFTPGNVGIVIGTYGIVWLAWLVVNRIVCDHMEMMVRFVLIL